jgi:hypothetical protein
MAGKFSLKMPDFRVAFRDLLHAVNLRHGTHSFTSLQKEGVLRIFFFALKNPTASAWFEPANLGSKGQHDTSRPPKPLLLWAMDQRGLAFRYLAEKFPGISSANQKVFISLTDPPSLQRGTVDLIPSGNKNRAWNGFGLVTTNFL